MNTFKGLGGRAVWNALTSFWSLGQAFKSDMVSPDSLFTTTEDQLDLE